MKHYAPLSNRLGDRQVYPDISARAQKPQGPSTESPNTHLDRSVVHSLDTAAPQRPPPAPPISGQARRSRSMSQPFPQASSGADGLVPTYLGSSDLQEERRDGRTMARHIEKGPRKAGKSAPNSKELATGSCMTCGGLVRWPSNLTVFKCTTCATVNDLETTDNHDMTSNGVGRRRDASHPGAMHSHHDDIGRATPLPVSLQQTRNIVRSCLNRFISRKIDESIGSDSLNDQQPQSSSQAYGPASGETPHQNDARRRLGAEPLNVSTQNPSASLSKSIEKTQGSSSSRHTEKPAFNSHFAVSGTSIGRGMSVEPKNIFKQLEEYLAECFHSSECLNFSFMPQSYYSESRQVPEQHFRRKPLPSIEQRRPSRDRGRSRGKADTEMAISELDPKLLLLGDVAENGLWWTGGQTPSPVQKPRRPDHARRTSASTRPLQMDWRELDSWYQTILSPMDGWFSVFDELVVTRSTHNVDLSKLENELNQGQLHVRNTLLKHIENLLKRPRRPVLKPADIRFILIILENPLLHHGQLSLESLGQLGSTRRRPHPIRQVSQSDKAHSGPSSGPLSGQHSGIIKRLIGLISNSPALCHNQLISWWLRYETERYVRAKDLFSGFLAYRLLRQRNKKPTKTVDDNAVTSFLIPQMRSGQSGAQLHDEIGALSLSNTTKKSTEPEKITSYPTDWQIKATSRVLALVFAANDPSAVRDIQHQHGGHGLPSSDFYVSMVDYIDLVKDFETWEAKQGLFSFCQYPFLLSLWAKTYILEHDTRRQMQSKARDAFIDSIMSNKLVKQYLTLTVRRECLVDDSLMAVSEVIGSGTDDIKKGLRIKFRGEEGIDGGGLRKEWFQLVIRDVFHPDCGMFLYDDDSKYCYFNPNSLESTDQYFLVGVVLGLAIYNSTILDVPLPPFAFKKLLASTPGHGMSSLAHSPYTLRYSLKDLAEYRPALARGLQHLLEYEGDVESTFALDFVIENERYGSVTSIALCEGGERRPVTNSNRREYVDLYIRHVLDVSVRRQFEPFRRGFYNVCGGNAFSLFRHGEIELLVRGSDEPLDVNSLRAVAEYQNWNNKQPDGVEPVVGWFWDTFQQAEAGEQRKLLSFITGSDRIPATGAASLRIKLSCLGDDCARFPVARTCFNQLSLWRYRTRQKLEYALWRAVKESEGFGLK